MQLKVSRINSNHTIRLQISQFLLIFLQKSFKLRISVDSINVINYSSFFFLVLRVTRTSTKSEISKAYRQLARIYHPDMHKTEEDKLKAVETFRTVANA